MSIYDHTIAHLDKSQFNSINEAYIGKTPILEEIQKKVHELRNSGLTMTNCSSTNKIVLNINRLFEKQFGMEIFALKILPTESIDAYNLPICCRIDMGNEDFSEYVEGNIRTGYSFKKDNKLAIVVCISLGLLNDKRFSDEAVMACLLHEVGHNFADCIDGSLRVYNKDLMREWKASLIQDMLLNVIASLAIWTIPFTVTNIIKDINYKNNNTNKYLYNREKKNHKKNPGSGRVLAFLYGKNGKRKDKKELRDIITTRTNRNYIDQIQQYKDNISDETKASIQKSPSRKSEVIADKFASIYGYGIGFSELMMTFDNISGSREYKMARKIRPGHKDINDEFEKVMFDINNFDEHPAGIQRMNSVLKTLKSEYEKEDIDPRIKEELIYQINQIQENLDNMCDASKKVYKIDKAQALYFDYLKQTAPDAISADIEEELDQELDKALEKQEKHYKSKKH